MALLRSADRKTGGGDSRLERPERRKSRYRSSNFAVQKENLGEKKKRKGDCHLFSRGGWREMDRKRTPRHLAGGTQQYDRTGPLFLTGVFRAGKKKNQRGGGGEGKKYIYRLQQTKGKGRMGGGLRKGFTVEKKKSGQKTKCKETHK